MSQATGRDVVSAERSGGATSCRTHRLNRLENHVTHTFQLAFTMRVFRFAPLLSLLLISGCTPTLSNELVAFQGVWEEANENGPPSALIVHDSTMWISDGRSETQYKLRIDGDKNHGVWVTSAKNGRIDSLPFTFDGAQLRLSSSDAALPSSNQYTKFTKKSDVAPNGDPVDQTYLPGLATFRYWTELSEIMKTMKGAVDGIGTPSNIDQGLAWGRQLDTAFRVGLYNASRLAIRRVDASATTYTTKYVQLLSAGQQITSDMITLLEQLRIHQANEPEMDGFWQSLGSLLSGDAARYASQTRQLQSGAAAVQQRFAHWRDAERALETEEFQLRTELSSRFSREFPAIEK